MSIPKKSVASLFKVRTREVIFLLAGVAIALAISATAQLTGAPATKPPCGELSDAIAQAANDKVSLVGMTSPDPGKYFNAGSPDSCLGDLSIADLDLSKLIPDPLGLLSVAVDGLIDKLKKAAVGAACKAVRNSVSDVITKINSGGACGGTGSKNLLDFSIGLKSAQSQSCAAAGWSIPSVTSTGLGLPSSPTTLPKTPFVTMTPPGSSSPASSPSSGVTGLGAAVGGAAGGP